MAGPRKPRPALACACVLGLMLAGCGFHLQGAYRLPESMDGVYVAYGNAYRAGDPPLVDALRQRLRATGKLGGPDAGARLVIGRVDHDREIVSISPIDGSVAEYKLRSEVVFDYVVDGRTLLTNVHLAVTRYYSYSGAARLAAEAERRSLLKRMQEQLANRIVFRIKRVTSQRDSRS